MLLPSQQERVLRKSNIVADSQTKSRKLSFESAQLSGSRLHVTRLVEGDAVWDIDIEEVLLAMSCRDLACLVKTQASVENALVTLNLLRNAATDNVSLRLASQL